MASQGALSPSTVVNDTATGSVSWSNPSNAGSDNGVYASFNGATNALTNYLKATGFGFSIPSGATIDGIVVEIESRNGGPDSQVRDNILQLVKGGTISGDDKADTTNNWTASADIYKSYGSSTDLWGLTLTADDVNDATFGVALSGKVVFADIGLDGRVDHIRITVYYSESGNATATPSPLSIVTSLALAAIITSSVLSPLAQALSFSLPTVNVSVSSAFAGSPIGLLLSLTRADSGEIVTPSVQTLTFSIPSVTVPQHITVSPSVLSATFSLPASTTEAVVEFEPNPVTATFSTQAPTVTAIQNVTVSAVQETLVFSVPSSTVFLGQVVSPSVQSATFSTQTPTVQYGVTNSPSVLSATFSFQTPIVGLGIVATPSTQALTFSLPSATVSIGIAVSPSPQILTFSAPTTSFLLDYKNFVSPLTITLAIPTPSRSGGFYTDKYQDRNTSYGDKYSTRSTTYNDKYSTRSTTYNDKYTPHNL